MTALRLATQADQTAALATASLRSRLPFNVKDYGAVGDGTTDDTAAIQAAITAATAAFVSTGRRQQVYVPPAAKYRVTFGLAAGKPAGYAVDFNAALRLYSGIDIFGGGEICPDPIVATTLTAPLVAGDTAIQVVSTAGFGSEPGFGNALMFSTTTTIRTWQTKTSTQFNIAQAWTGATLPTGAIVVMRTSRAVFVTDFANEITDWSVRGIRINGGNTQAVEQGHEAVIVGPARRWDISDCEITGLLGKGLHVIGETTGALRIPRDWTMARCRIHDIAGNAVGHSWAGTRDFKIIDNVFRDNLLGGAEAITAAGQSNYSRGLIRGNLVINYGDINCNGSTMICTHNTILMPATALGPCINVNNANGMLIADNILDASAITTATTVDHGVQVATSATTDLTIRGNQIKRPPQSTSGAGILTQLGSGTHLGLKIIDNSISGNTGAVEADISLGNASGAVVARNTCQNATAITVKTTATETVLAGNTVPNGVLVVDGADTIVQGNYVQGTTGTGDCLRVGGSRCVVTGNRFRGRSSSGIAGTISATGTDGRFTGNVVEQTNTSQRWINEASPADRNTFDSNTFIGTNGNVSLAGAASRMKRNTGYVTEGSGAASVADAGTIAHGMSKTPTRVTLTPSVAGRVVAVTALGSTTFTVSLRDNVDAAVVVAETVYWGADG